MRRIIEPPMHIDSALSANIQLADWIAAYLSRAIDYQLVEHSRYAWVTSDRACPALRGSFTHESKLHLHRRSVDDIVHSRVLNRSRPLYPTVHGQRISSSTPTHIQRRLHALGQRRKDGS